MTSFTALAFLCALVALADIETLSHWSSKTATGRHVDTRIPFQHTTMRNEREESGLTKESGRNVTLYLMLIIGV